MSATASRTLGPSAIEGYTTTLQHIEMLHCKRDQLRQAQLEAERQHLHRIACAWEGGVIDEDGLELAYRQYKALAMPGYSIRWNEVMAISAARLLNRARSQRYRQPSGPHGTWSGTHPFGAETTPGTGMSVVYILFDEINKPCYVGSTAHFRTRLNRHAKEGKRFISWTAYPCASRDAAYLLETRLLREHKPYLNKRTVA